MISWQVMGDVSMAAMKDETKNVTFCTFDPFWGWGDIRLSFHIPISAHVIAQSAFPVECIFTKF